MAAHSMNLAQDTQNEMLFVGFNQDYGCFVCGTDSGFKIFNSDPFKETFSRDFGVGGIGYVEMLFRCNILALVGGGRNPKYPTNKVIIWDDHQSRCIGELSYRSTVRAVKLRRDRLVVVLEFKVYVYNFLALNLQLVNQIHTISNIKGLCALCPFPDHNVLVCPGLEPGYVRVELFDEKKVTIIPAHKNPLACFALNSDGTRLATASEEGTLIRIFDTKTAVRLQELRRGADPAQIYSLCFDKLTQWLAVSSDKSTVHIFSIEDNKRSQGQSDHKRLGPPATETKVGESKNPRSSLSFLSGILPTYFASQWSFAQYRVPAHRTIVAFGSDKNSIIVVSADGTFYKAFFDPQTPGRECVQESWAAFIPPSKQNT